MITPKTIMVTAYKSEYGFLPGRLLFLQEFLARQKRLQLRPKQGNKPAGGLFRQL